MKSEAVEFFQSIVNTSSPTGYETGVAELYHAYVEPFADRVDVDVMGNVTAILNPDAKFKVMLAAHMDEIGLMIHHISEDGFLHFQMIGGNNSVVADGQRVWVLGKERIAGVVGRKASMVQSPEEMKLKPTSKDLWIDIGASSRAEAEEVVSLGDVVTFQPEFMTLLGERATGRAFDNKAGLTIVAEALRRLKENGRLNAEVGVYAVATTQEEIGSRGAQTAAFRIDPQTALAVDMGVATDTPTNVASDFGMLAVGKGPAISRGPNTNRRMFEILAKAAEGADIPYQVRPDPSTSPTDARVLQTTRMGVATALLEVPLRYMHTPCEVLSLADVENCARLMAAYCEALTPDTEFRMHV